MKKVFCVLTLALMAVTAAVAQDVIGKWKLEDGSAIVEIYKQNEVYNGRIVWLNEPNGPDGKPALDVNNPDKSLRSRKLMGLNMLHGLKPANGEYSGGKIYDPSGQWKNLQLLHESGRKSAQSARLARQERYARPHHGLVPRGGRLNFLPIG